MLGGGDDHEGTCIERSRAPVRINTSTDTRQPVAVTSERKDLVQVDVGVYASEEGFLGPARTSSIHSGTVGLCKHGLVFCAEERDLIVPIVWREKQCFRMLVISCGGLIPVDQVKFEDDPE